MIAISYPNAQRNQTERPEVAQKNAFTARYLAQQWERTNPGQPMPPELQQQINQLKGIGSGVRKPGMTDLYEQSLQQARQATESRYQQALDRLKGQGKTELGDINQRYGQLAAQSQQDLVSRGLSGSTVMPALQMGMEQSRAREVGALGERLNRQYIDVLGSRRDTSPSLEQLLALRRGEGTAFGAGRFGRLGGGRGGMAGNRGFGGRRISLGGDPLSTYNEMRQRRLAGGAQAGGGAGFGIGGGAGFGIGTGGFQTGTGSMSGTRAYESSYLQDYREPSYTMKPPTNISFDY